MTEESISTREGPEDCKVQDGEEVEQQGHRIAAEETPQYAFYTKFLATQAELSQRIAGLATLAPAARNEQIQDLLREIAELNEEIHDARSFLPGYDLRSYSEQVRTLQASLQKTRDSLNVRPKFSFKSRPKAAPAANAVTQKSTPSTSPPTPASPSTTPAPASMEGVYKISSPAPGSLLVPPEKPYTSLQVEGISRCCLSHLKASPPNTAALKDIANSIIVLPRVEGPVHVTAVTRSVLVLPWAHQVRIHECIDSTIVVKSRSGPIIEHCKGLKFAALPENVGYSADKGAGTDGIGEVQDFSWLREGKNPHFDKVEGAAEEIWPKIDGTQEGNVEEVLRDLKLL